MSEEIKACPFCGVAPDVDRMDRLIVFKCGICSYSRGFKGVLQAVDNGKPCGNGIEFYHQHAYEDAKSAWNRRAYIQ